MRNWNEILLWTTSGAAMRMLEASLNLWIFTEYLHYIYQLLNRRMLALSRTAPPVNIHAPRVIGIIRGKDHLLSSLKCTALQVVQTRYDASGKEFLSDSPKCLMFQVRLINKAQKDETYVWLFVSKVYSQPISYVYIYMHTYWVPCIPTHPCSCSSIFCVCVHFNMKISHDGWNSTRCNQASAIRLFTCTMGDMGRLSGCQKQTMTTQTQASHWHIHAE